MTARWVAITAVTAIGCGRVGFADQTHDAADTAGRDAGPLDGCPMSASLTAGLVGWWTFDEGSGTIAHDSAAGNDGVLIGGATWVPGHLGDAVSLDGVTGWVDIGGSAAYATHNAAFTFAAWTNLTSWLNGTPDIMEIATDNASSPFHVLWSDQTQYFGMSTGDGDGSWVPTLTGAEPTTGAWHHVVMIYDGNGATQLTSFQFYLDGVAQPMVTQAAGYATQTNVSRIGAAEAVANNWYGLIDDVRIYDRALSGTEVAELFALTCD